MSEPASSPTPKPQVSLAERMRAHSLWFALAIVLMWGSNFSIHKYAVETVQPAGFLIVRYCLVLPVCCVVLMLFRYGLSWPRLNRKDIYDLFVVGIIGHVLHVGLVTWGIYLSTPFSSALLLAIGPVFTLLIMRFMSKEQLSMSAIIGVSLAGLGILVFMSDKLILLLQQRSTFERLLGDFILVFAASMFSLHTLRVRSLNNRMGIIPVMAYSTLLVVPFMAILASPWGWTQLSDGFRSSSVTGSEIAKLLGALFYSIVIAAFLGWVLWAWVNVVRGPAKSAPLMYLVPVVAGTVAWFVGSEEFTAIKLLGAAITLVGVAVAQFVRRASAVPVEPPE